MWMNTFSDSNISPFQHAPTARNTKTLSTYFMIRFRFNDLQCVFQVTSKKPILSHSFMKFAETAPTERRAIFATSTSRPRVVPINAISFTRMHTLVLSGSDFTPKLLYPTLHFSIASIIVSFSHHTPHSFTFVNFILFSSSFQQLILSHFIHSISIIHFHSLFPKFCCFPFCYV